mmetsp:Transcript_27993/g.38496  ORF Transcript_27993/g.38496 Transcript_27993/m.38496 type:complete len:139 (+) Transcript_27993:686-1102(+)
MLMMSQDINLFKMKRRKSNAEEINLFSINKKNSNALCYQEKGLQLSGNTLPKRIQTTLLKRRKDWLDVITVELGQYYLVVVQQEQRFILLNVININLYFKIISNINKWITKISHLNENIQNKAQIWLKLVYFNKMTVH